MLRSRSAGACEAGRENANDDGGSTVLQHSVECGLRVTWSFHAVLTMQAQG
jgi:hypothetical protein